MGFMGLSHWVESDGAADFKYGFEEKIRSEAYQANKYYD